MEDNWYDFRTDRPQSGQRVLVTDGDVVVAACFMYDGENYMWLFDDINHAQCNIEVNYWQPLPTPKKWLNQVSAQTNITSSNSL